MIIRSLSSVGAFAMSPAPDAALLSWGAAGGIGAAGAAACSALIGAGAAQPTAANKRLNIMMTETKLRMGAPPIE
jgi:hypothetical protein